MPGGWVKSHSDHRLAWDGLTAPATRRLAGHIHHVLSQLGALALPRLQTTLIESVSYGEIKNHRDDSGASRRTSDRSSARCLGHAF
jgi:hypothetical protein